MRTIPFHEADEAPTESATERQVLEETPSVGLLHPDSALPAKRHFDLLHLIRQRGQMTVHELSESLQVSGDTIRRDLALLARHGLLVRTYGGAVANDVAAATPSSTLAQKIGIWHPAEKIIAQAASRLIGDREKLLLNEGSITTILAAELTSENHTVVTNNLGVPAVVPAGCEVYVLGGHYQRKSRATLGPLLLSGVAIAVDTAIIEVGGITLEQGLTASWLEEAITAKAMIEAASRTIVVVEAAKFGRSCFARIAPLLEIDIVVTDSEPPSELFQALSEAQVQVIIARKL